jgi:hypothetical protein
MEGRSMFLIHLLFYNSDESRLLFLWRDSLPVVKEKPRCNEVMRFKLELLFDAPMSLMSGTVTLEKDSHLQLAFEIPRNQALSSK